MKSKRLLLNLLAAFLPALIVLGVILVRVLGVTDGAAALYAMAVEAVEAGNYDQADDYFSQLETDYPDYIPQYELQAERYTRDGNSTSAIAALEKGAEVTGSEYLQQLADNISSRPHLQLGTFADADTEAGEMENFSKDTLVSMNHDFVVRYTNTQMGRQVQLSIANLFSIETFHWTSSNPQVASVDRNGVLTCGNQPGEAEILVTSQSGMYAYCWVYVIQSEIFADDLSSNFVYVPEGDFSYLDFYGPNPEEIIETVQNNGLLQNIPVFTLQGDDLLNSGIGGYDADQTTAAGEGPLYERVDENGNPVFIEESQATTEVADGSIQLDIGWQSFYFSGEFRIPSTLRANNGKDYTVSTVNLGNFSSDITNLYIPATVTSFGEEGENPFQSLWYLESIEVEEGNPSYSSIDGVMYSADGTKLIAYPIFREATDFEIPNGVVEICSGAFATNPFGGNPVLKDSHSLQSITIPASVSIIQPGAFSGIDTLKKIELDPANTNFRMENGFLLDLEGNVLGFAQDSISNDMVISTESEEINFQQNQEMESLTIEADVGTVNVETCEALHSIYINGNVDTFYVYNCPVLEQIVINGEVRDATISHYNNINLVVSLNAPVYSFKSYDNYVIENLDDVTNDLYICQNNGNLELSDSLRSLYLTLPAGIAVDASAFSNGSLEQFSLSGGRLTDLSFVSGMSKLWMLDLSNVQVDDWSGIWNASQLTMLGIENCTGISDISGVASLSHLTSFEFTGMQIEDISPLASCQQLQRIMLTETTGLDNLSVLSSLPNLHYISLRDSDATEEDKQILRDAGIMVE